MCVCVCVFRQRERQTDRQTDRQREGQRKRERKTVDGVERERQELCVCLMIDLLLSSGRFARNIYNGKKYNGTFTGSVQIFILFEEMNCP